MHPHILKSSGGCNENKIKILRANFISYCLISDYKAVNFPTLRSSFLSLRPVQSNSPERLATEAWPPLQVIGGSSALKSRNSFKGTSGSCFVILAPVHPSSSSWSWSFCFILPISICPSLSLYRWASPSVNSSSCFSLQNSWWTSILVFFLMFTLGILFVSYKVCEKLDVSSVLSISFFSVACGVSETRLSHGPYDFLLLCTILRGFYSTYTASCKSGA